MKRLSRGLATGVALLAMGCAEPLHLLERGPSAGPSPYSFWPPPPASAVWLPPPVAATPTAELSGVASEVQTSLRRAGYVDLRWFPIGSHYQHGFAVATRLERTDGQSGSPTTRWFALYPDPVNLRWLTFARTPTLPEPGEYRAFLIAFTDLPMSSGTNAPIWNEQTVMDGPGSPERRSAPVEVIERLGTANYRLGVFEYGYGWDAAEQRGRFRSADDASAISGWPAPLPGLLTPQQAGQR